MRLTPCAVAGSNLSRVAVQVSAFAACYYATVGREHGSVTRSQSGTPCHCHCTSFDTGSQGATSWSIRLIPNSLSSRFFAHSDRLFRSRRRCSRRYRRIVSRAGGEAPFTRRARKTLTRFEAIARTSCVVLTWPGGPGPSSGSAASANSLRPLLPPASMRFYMLIAHAMQNGATVEKRTFR